MKMKTKKDETKLTGIVYFCGYLNKEIILKEDYHFSGYEQECELCGSHGSVKVYFKCECGKEHDIEIDSW